MQEQLVEEDTQVANKHKGIVDKSHLVKTTMVITTDLLKQSEKPQECQSW